MLCPVCKKRSRVGGVRKLLRGHYNPTTKRVRHPNLQWVTIAPGKRIKMCAACKKRAAKEPAYLKRKGIV